MEKIKRIKIKEGIKHLNKKNGKTIPDADKYFIAHILKISYPTIHAWDKGDTIPKSIQTLYDMSVYFGVPMEELLEIQKEKILWHI